MTRLRDLDHCHFFMERLKRLHGAPVFGGLWTESHSLKLRKSVPDSSGVNCDTMKMLWTICVIFIGCFVDICYTKGIDLGFCDDTEFICACGQSNSRVTLKIKR
ncbi:UNVERIFIED_CONTAM: hypothetical protein NCL1_42440 [Trichonephila clavipes]